MPSRREPARLEPNRVQRGRIVGKRHVQTNATQRPHPASQKGIRAWASNAAQDLAVHFPVHHRDAQMPAQRLPQILSRLALTRHFSHKLDWPLKQQWQPQALFQKTDREYQRLERQMSCDRQTGCIQICLSR